MQHRSNRGSGKPVWVRAHQARACVWDPAQRIALGPAVMETASTGRTHDCTRPICINVKTTLAKREPSTHDPKTTFGRNEKRPRRTAPNIFRLPLRFEAALIARDSVTSVRTRNDGKRRRMTFEISSLVPELWCSDVKESLDFYTCKLGFEVAQQRGSDPHAYSTWASAILRLGVPDPSNPPCGRLPESVTSCAYGLDQLVG